MQVVNLGSQTGVYVRVAKGDPTLLEQDLFPITVIPFPKVAVMIYSCENSFSPHPFQYLALLVIFNFSCGSDFIYLFFPSLKDF